MFGCLGIWENAGLSGEIYEEFSQKNLHQHQKNHLGNEQKPWLFILCRDEILPGYIGVIMNYCKDPY